MAKVVTLVEPFEVNPRDSDTFVVDCTGLIDTRTISSVVIDDVGGLTANSAAVVTSSYSYTDEKGDTRTIDANHAIQFHASGFTAGSNYLVRLTATLSDGEDKGITPEFWCREGTT